MNKWVVYGLIGVAVVVVAAAAYVMLGQSSSGLSDSDAVAIELRPTDRIHGDTNAPVTIVEYASMTCPHCARFQQNVLPEVVRNYIDTGKAKIVYRDFPLDGAARLASALALCVPKDKYFSFLDLLFLNQKTWLADTNSDNRVSADEVVNGLVQMGRFVGYNREKVESCIGDQQTLAYIDQTQAEAQSKYGVAGTPTFYVNGVPLKPAHAGELNYDDVRQAVDSQLAKKK